MTAPSTSDLLNLSNVVYTTGGTAPLATITIGGVIWTQIAFRSQTINGMQAAAYQNSDGVVVIAFEGTNKSNAGANQTLLDEQLASWPKFAAGNSVPAADPDALAFVQQVAQLVGNNPIYVTGHSLGGEEAAYVQNQADTVGIAKLTGGGTIPIAGGASFGGPGIPGVTIADANPNFTTYADVGDVVPTHPTGVVTIGKPQPEGSIIDAIEEKLALTIPSLAPVAAGLALNDHSLQHYANDLGITLISTSSNDYGSPDLTTPIWTGTGPVIIGSTTSSTVSYSVAGNAGEIFTNTGATVNLPTAGSSLAVIDAASSSGATVENISVGSDGTVSVTDAAGNQFASYTAAQAAGGTVQINGSEIDVLNSANQKLDSTQEINVGSGAVGVLDNVYSGTTAGITKVNAGGQDTTTAVYVNDSGIGVAVASIASLYYYQNGTVTPLMSGGRQVLLDDQADRVFVDNKGELFVDSAVHDTLTIYSSITGGVLGSSTTLSYQNGLPFRALDTISISPNGNLIMSQTQTAQDGTSSVQIYNRTTGTTQTVNLPTYTYPDGTVAYFNANFGGINDNGLIVGAYTNAIVNNPQPGKGGGNILVNYVPDGYDNVVVGGLYNSQTGSLTIIADPNLQSLPGGNGGLFLSGINDSGEVVGTYTKAVNVPIINNPNNLLPGSGYSPQVYVEQAFVYKNGSYSDVGVPVAPGAVYDETLNRIAFNDTIASGVTNNGTVSVYALAEPDQNGSITDSQDAYVVSPGGTVDTSTFNVVGNGTIDLRSTTQIAGVKTIQLQEGQAGYTNGSTVIANTEQTVYLQNGLNATVNVASDASINTQNPNAAGIIIYGAQDSDTINLGTGNDTVYLGSAFETVNGGGGNNAFYVTSSTIGATINGGTGQNALDITGGGTVTMGGNITNIKTVNLATAPAGQTQPNYNFTANGIAGLTITDSSSGNDMLTAGNVTGDTLSVYGSHGNNTLTVQDVLSNNPGANWNNTLAANVTSGNNTLTVGDGSYDLLRTDWSTGANSLTAGNGSHNWLNAESSTGVNTLTVGSGSNNTLDVSFSSGNDTLQTVNGSSDYLNASSSAGNDTLTVGNGNSNTLDVSFSTGVNNLTAGNGNSDWLNAESSKKANTLHAGDGNNDTLDVSFSSGNNIAVAGNGSGDYLNANSSTGNNVLTAGSGANDTFSAVWSTGQNIFNAGTGNTTLFGGEGYTTYKFGSAFGQDTLWNSGSSSGQGASAVQGEIDFTSSATTYENLWFKQSGNDLVVQLLGTADTITVKGWFGSNAGAEVQTFNAGGLTLSNTAVAALVSAMATYQAANSSFSPANAASMPTNGALQSAMALAWHKYDSVTLNGDGSWTGTLNDHVGGNWTSITDHYSPTDQLTETYELFNNGTATDTAFVSGITLTGNNTVGETITASSTGGDTISLLSNAIATVNGGSATINLAGGSNATLTGGSPETVNMNGANATLTDASSAVNTINVNATGAAIYASGDTINAAANLSLTDNWGNNSVNLASGDTLTIGQNGDTVTGSNGTLWLDGHMTVTVNGNGNGIWANNGAPNNTVTVNGNGNQVGISSGSVTMAGNNDTASLGAAGDTATLTGTGEWATASNDTVTFGANSTGTVSGNDNTVNVGLGTTATLNSTGGNTINVTGGGNSVVYDTAGANDIVNVSGNGTTDDYLIMSNAAITIQNNARADTYGSHNTITAGSNDIVGAYYGTNNALTIGSNSGAWLGNGSNNTVNINGTGGSTVNDSDTSGDIMNVSGNGTNGTADGVTMSNGTVAVASNANAYVVGNSDAITGGSNDTVGVYGTGDALTIGANGIVNMGANGGNTINVTGLGGTVVWDQSSTGDTVNVSGNLGGSDNYIVLSNGTVALQSNAGADVYGNNNGITAGTVDGVGVHGINNAVTLGSNNAAWIYDSNNVVNLGASGDAVTLESSVSNTSIIGSNGTINAADGDMFNLTGANVTVVASNGIAYLNASTTSITFQGSNEVIHIRAGDTYTITGTGDTVITDTVVTAHNGSTIASYNGVSSLVDITGLAFDSSITATIVQNSGGFAAQMFVSDHGSVVDTINLQSVQNLGGLTVRSDGSGGTLIVDPPLSAPAQDSIHQAFNDAWHTLMGRTDIGGASSSHGAGQQFDFSGLTPNSPIPEDQHNSLRDFSHANAALIRDGPAQHAEPLSILGADHFDFSSLPSNPATDHLDHQVQLFTQYAAALAGDVSMHQTPEPDLPITPDFQHLAAVHLAQPDHGWHL